MGSSGTVPDGGLQAGVQLRLYAQDGELAGHLEQHRGDGRDHETKGEGNRTPSAWGMATSICLVTMSTSAPRSPAAAPMGRTRSRSTRRSHGLYFNRSHAPSGRSGKGA